MLPTSHPSNTCPSKQTFWLENCSLICSNLTSNDIMHFSKQNSTFCPNFAYQHSEMQLVFNCVITQSSAIRLTKTIIYLPLLGFHESCIGKINKNTVEKKMILYKIFRRRCSCVLIKNLNIKRKEKRKWVKRITSRSAL